MLRSEKVQKVKYLLIFLRKVLQNSTCVSKHILSIERVLDPGSSSAGIEQAGSVLRVIFVPLPHVEPQPAQRGYSSPRQLNQWCSNPCRAFRMGAGLGYDKGLLHYSCPPRPAHEPPTRPPYHWFHNSTLDASTAMNTDCSGHSSHVYPLLSVLSVS